MSLKISIVTPSYNQGVFIRDTIESVMKQNYSNYEHIVVDGGSTDETVNILKEYKHLKWISEKDNGPSNAINKGFEMATGEIYGWINSDDYYEENIFMEVEKEFRKKEVKFLCGDMTIVDINKKYIFSNHTPKLLRDNLINNSIDIRQPSTFFSSDLFKSVGGLDESLKLTFDYELFLRMLEKTDSHYIQKNLSYYRDHVFTLTRRQIRKQAIELFKVTRKYGAKYTSRIMRTILRKFITGKI